MYRKKGFTLLELVMYVALFMVLSLVAFDSVVTMGKAFVAVRMNRSETSAAIAVLERVGREVRSASYLDDAASTYDVASGRLTVARSSGSATTTTSFVLTNGRITVSENGATSVPLSDPSVSVESFLVRKAAASTTRAVKIELGLRHARTATSTLETFSTTALLRGTY